MDDILNALAEQHAELAELVDGCTNDDWDRATRCEGWDVAAVLLHLAQTDEFAAASAGGLLGAHPHGLMGDRASEGLTVDAAAAGAVDADRAVGGDAIRQRWHDASHAMRVAFEAGDPHTRVIWVHGRLSLHTLTATRLSECWIHTGDIASALDIDLEPTDRLRYIARLAWRTLPYAFECDHAHLTGPVALELVGPHGDEWRFEPDAPARTTIRGSAVEFCDVAARRVDPADTDLEGDGPDAAAVLRLVRTYAL